MRKLDSRWSEWGAGERLIVQVKAEHCERFFVYVAWGRARTRPLYIGKSNGFLSRIGTHVKGAKWADQVVRFEAYPFTSEEAASAAEIEAISAFNPIHNVIRPATPAEEKAHEERWQVGIAAKAAEAKRKRLEREAVSAAWRARQAAKPPREPKPVRERVRTERPQSPWRRRSLRKAGEWPDYFIPDQFAIIRRVQNRDRAA